MHLGLPAHVWYPLQRLWGVRGRRSSDSSGKNLPSKLLCLYCLQVSHPFQLPWREPSTRKTGRKGITMRHKFQDMFLFEKHLVGRDLLQSLTLRVFKILLTYLEDTASLLHLLLCSQKVTLAYERITYQAYMLR